MEVTSVHGMIDGTNGLISISDPRGQQAFDLVKKSSKISPPFYNVIAGFEIGSRRRSGSSSARSGMMVERGQ